MNHKKAPSFSVLQMRDICCQLSWFGYKFCHFSLELRITKRKDCVIKVLHIAMQLLLTDSSPPPARHMVMGSARASGKGLCVRDSHR